MGVIGTFVHGELLDHLPAKPVLGQHPTDRLLYGEGRPLGHEARVAQAPKATRVPGVVVEDLLVLLAAGQPNPAGVHHDDVVAGVGVRGEDRLVLAAQDLGHL